MPLYSPPPGSWIQTLPYFLDVTRPVTTALSIVTIVPFVGWFMRIDFTVDPCGGESGLPPPPPPPPPIPDARHAITPKITTAKNALRMIVHFPPRAQRIPHDVVGDHEDYRSRSCALQSAPCCPTNVPNWGCQAFSLARFCARHVPSARAMRWDRALTLFLVACTTSRGTGGGGGGGGDGGGGSDAGGGTTTLSELRFAIVGDTRPASPDDTANYPTA